MKKHHFLLLLAWVLTVNLNAQTQLKKWILGDNNSVFDMSNPQPVLYGTLGAGNKPILKNSMHDNKGRLLFYVGDWKIYDGFGNVICDIDCIPGGTACHNADINPEYPIVPCIEDNNSCRKRYYVFYTNTDYLARNVKLFAKIVTVDNNEGKVTAVDVKDASGNRRILDYSATYANFPGVNWQATGLAVSQVKQTFFNDGPNDFVYNRYLYWIAGEVRKITITKVDDANDGISTSQTIFSIYQNPVFKFNTFEADLSHDGQKLVWSSSLENVSQHDYYYLELDNKGDWDNVTNEVFSVVTKIADNGIGLRGVEFTPDGSELVVSTGGISSPVTGSWSHGIYHKPLIPLSSPFQFVSNSQEHGTSQLELAQNGLIYAASPTYTYLGYAGVELNTFTFPHGIVNSGFTTTAQSFLLLYCLPDQIDGEDYNSTLIDFYDLGSYTFPGINNATNTIVINSSNTWPYFHHLGSRIKVTGTLSFVFPNIPGPPAPRTTWVLDRLDFSMAKGSKIIIGDNMDVQLISCSFQSADCAEMWEGIEVQGTGTLTVFGSSTVFKQSEILDAKTAISVSGGNALLSVSNTVFNRNGTHIRIMDYKHRNASGIDIKLNQFLHTQPLRIFQNGVQFPTANIFGTTGIELGGTYIDPDATLFLSGNTFEGGTYGILSYGIPFQMSTSGGSTSSNFFRNFSNSNSVCIKVDMLYRTPAIDIEDAYFTDINQAAYITGRANINFKRNRVTRSVKHAVEIYANRGRTITLTNNTFIDFARSAVLLNSNAGSAGSIATDILIADNDFSIVNLPPTPDMDKPTGITVMEPSLITSQKTFRSIRITNNTMNNVAFGIKTTAINGLQLMDKPYNDDYSIFPILRNDINDLDNNNIRVYATFTTPVPANSDYNTGIQLNNSRGLVAVDNILNSNQFTQWRSSGIFSDNTSQTLFFRNNIQTAGRGIGAAYYAMGNDIKCNMFTRAVNGISLQDYKMRLPWLIHGEKLTDSRDNNYVRTTKENIELYLYRVPSTAINIQDHIDANQWLMNTSPSMLIEPTPACSPFINCIRQFGAPDHCGFGWSGLGNGDKLVYDVPPSDPSGDDLYDWQLKYEYERQQKEKGLVYNGLLSSLIDVEHYISEGNNADALQLLNGMLATNVYESNYIQLFTILVNARLEGERLLNEQEIAVYMSIAAQNTYEAGPVVYLARAILWQQEGLNYVDMVDRNSGNIGIQLDGEECMGQIPEGFNVQLMREDGYVYNPDEVPLSLDENGYVFIPNNIVATFPQNQYYTFILDNGNYPSPEFQTLADWMDNDNNTIFLCNNGLLGNAKNSQESNDHGKQPGSSQQAIQKAEALSKIDVFPNPAKDFVTVILPSQGEYTITVYDVMGKNVYAQKHSQKATLSTDNYNTGIYLIKITDSNGTLLTSKKVMIRQ
jgi:hypothetical protein